MKAIASHNGLAAASRAFEILQSGGAPLDACVEGVTLIENDPEELTVGFGGLPNEDGIVELDAAVMDGRTHRGAGVAALRGIRNPAKVARVVMQQTNRVLLAGEGALNFALQLFLLSKDGKHAGVALWGPKLLAVTDERGARLEPCVPLFEK